MRRQSICGGGWFDLDRAVKYAEATYFDGRNRISVATGDQWVHEVLYLTANGAYVLNRWSQWQGAGQSWTCLGEREAAAWLVRNGHEAPKGLERATAELEV